MFSQRYGYAQSDERQQGISKKTKDRLWNSYFEKIYSPMLHTRNNELAEEYIGIMKTILRDIFGIHSDVLESKGLAYWDDVFKDHFFKIAWYKLFDLLEFILSLNDENICPQMKRAGIIDSFKDECNRVLKTENSCYRMVDSLLVRNFEDCELLEIDTALTTGGRYKKASDQLKKAVKLLFDRTSPDYENCSKEAIISVETLLRLIIGVDKGTIGEMVKTAAITKNIHPCIIKAIEGLHGYCSDASGVRHAVSTDDLKIVSEKEARFILVACTAIFNYIVNRFSKLGNSNDCIPY